jgi:taurine transport system substrate-binding protein
MLALVKALAKADADYRANPKAWTSDKAKVAAVAKWSGGKPEDVADAMALYGFPSLQEQASPAWLGGGANGAATKALAQQASFLKEQGRLTSVAPDFSKNVSTEWVTKAAAK